ncbi:hypothetical protein DI09_210p30, partial [Mitosporidium daphniae]
MKAKYGLWIIFTSLILFNVYAKDPSVNDQASTDVMTNPPISKDPNLNHPVSKDPSVKDPVSKDSNVKAPVSKNPNVKKTLSKTLRYASYANPVKVAEHVGFKEPVVSVLNLAVPGLGSVLNMANDASKFAIKRLNKGSNSDKGKNSSSTHEDRVGKAPLNLSNNPPNTLPGQQKEAIKLLENDSNSQKNQKNISSQVTPSNATQAPVSNWSIPPTPAEATPSTLAQAAAYNSSNPAQNLVYNSSNQAQAPAYNPSNQAQAPAYNPSNQAQAPAYNPSNQAQAPAYNPSN